MPTIADTTAEMIQFVFPEHAGAPGQIHGGRMMQWITQAGTMAAARVARGTVLLGAMDDIDFLHPVKVGEVAILRAQVEYVGRSSLEVGVRVWGENVATGQRTVTLNSHLVYVTVDDDARPRPVGRAIEPGDPAEAEMMEAARGRRENRLARFARRTEPRCSSPSPPTIEPDLADPATTDPATTHLESVRSVLPEDALFGNMMFPGKMLMDIDEAGGILSMRYCKGFVMTACLDAMDFYSPIFTHEVVVFKAALNHVGTSSMEIGVKVMAERPWTGEVRHACTAFLTYVHLGTGGPDSGVAWRPWPVPSFTPRTVVERRRWDEATVRRELRIERVKRLRAALQGERG
jgi:acyl-CoA hydrolase